MSARQKAEGLMDDAMEALGEASGLIEDAIKEAVLAERRACLAIARQHSATAVENAIRAREARPHE